MHDIDLSASKIEAWLREDNPVLLQRLWRAADSVRRDTVGDQVHLRGLIDFSNRCRRNCLYCGLRRANTGLHRYCMSATEILSAAALAHSLGYGTVVLQAGEYEPHCGEWLADVVAKIKSCFPIAVTLSVGEWSYRHYQMWRESGADRYLLRFETSDIALFEYIHPGRTTKPRHRLDILRDVKAAGYEVGSGIMVGIPGQTYESVVHDLSLFRSMDLDMIGIGPYIANNATPLGRSTIETRGDDNQIPATALMACKVLALTRLMCPEANIPATTALATVVQDGYTIGLRSGANVIMPDLTPDRYRRNYVIYPIAKDCPDRHSAESVLDTIVRCGRRPGLGRGDRKRREVPK